MFSKEEQICCAHMHSEGTESCFKTNARLCSNNNLHVITKALKGKVHHSTEEPHQLVSDGSWCRVGAQESVFESEGLKPNPDVNGLCFHLPSSVLHWN